MKADTKKLLVGGLLVGTAIYLLRQRQKPTQAEEAEAAFVRYRDVVKAPLVTAPLKIPARVQGAPEPLGGWQAWLTPAELLAGITACRAAGSATPVEQAACTLDGIFLRAEWPPGPQSAPWQREAWDTTLEAAQTLAGGPTKVGS